VELLSQTSVQLFQPRFKSPPSHPLRTPGVGDETLLIESRDDDRDLIHCIMNHTHTMCCTAPLSPTNAVIRSPNTHCYEKIQIHLRRSMRERGGAYVAFPYDTKKNSAKGRGPRKSHTGMAFRIDFT